VVAGKYYNVRFLHNRVNRLPNTTSLHGNSFEHTQRAGRLGFIIKVLLQLCAEFHIFHTMVYHSGKRVFNYQLPLVVVYLFFNKKVVAALQLLQAGTAQALPGVVLGNKTFFLKAQFYSIALAVGYIAHPALKHRATAWAVFNFMHRPYVFDALD
jgi:hypothetical protein